MVHDLADQLDLLIRSRAPILWIRSLEEERVEALLERAAERLGDRTLLRWDFIGGLAGAPNLQGQAARHPMAALDGLEGLPPEQGAILLLKDFHRYADDPGICRRLRNLAASLRRVPHTLVISAPEWQLPRELEDSITLLELPLPDAGEIGALLRAIAEASGQPLEAGVLEQLTAACHGLSEQRVRQLAARALARRGQLGADDLAEVLEEKRQAIARSELLEYCPTEATPADIGGLEALKHWLEQRHRAFGEEAQRYGLPLPRGVLLIGPQGTGKSLTAKAIAHSWSMPLLRLDVGRLFAGLVGASEARTREMIQRAEAMAPCVLWIDEIDKGFGGGEAAATAAPASGCWPACSPGWRRRPARCSWWPPPTRWSGCRRSCCARAASTRSSCWICPTPTNGGRSWICSCAAAGRGTRSPWRWWWIAPPTSPAPNWSRR